MPRFFFNCERLLMTLATQHAMEPGFIIIGAAKSGTTSLHALLGQHPSIHCSNPKETNFFSYDAVHARGWKWYESCFAGMESGQIAGEASPTYSDRLSYPRTAERMAAALPGIKLIYIVRNPIERLASHWRMLTRDDASTPSFRRALKSRRLRPFLAERSRYWFQINAFRDRFPDTHIQVVFFEDFKEDPVRELDRCASFLGVENFPKVANPKRAYNNGVAMTAGRSEKQALQVLRRLPLVDAAKRLIPDPVKELLWRLPLFTRKQEVDVPWTSELKRRIVDELRDDARQFLKFYGKSADYWCLGKQ